MKKLINVLSITSIVPVVAIFLIEVFWNDKSPRTSFICLWWDLLLFVFAIPIAFGWLSLAMNKDKINPKIWLAIFGCAVSLYIVMLINFGFVNMTKDLPLAAREEYSMINGTVRIIESNASRQIIEVEGIQFNLPKDTFNEVIEYEDYTVYYLPNSKHVINVIDKIEITLIRGIR